MGQKANLIHQYFSLKHKFDILEDSTHPCPEIPSNKDINYMSKEFSVQDLKDKINSVEMALDQRYIRISTENYWAEHLEEKINYENKLKEIIENRKTRITDIRNSLNETIKNVLGQNWTCTCNFNYDSASMEIGIENNDEERQGHTFKFGHDFDLSFDRKYRFSDSSYDKEYELRMNYGCLGSFDLTGPESNEDRIAFLKGMGQFVKDTDLIAFIKETLKFGCAEEIKGQKEYKDIENILKNPLKYLNK